MIVLPQMVEVLVSSRSQKYYEDLEYEIPRKKDSQRRFTVPRGTKILVSVEDLPKGTHQKINVICDYCLQPYQCSYYSYLTMKKNEYVQKDSCVNCSPIKIREVTILKYGVDNVMQVKKIKDKAIETNIERYGFKNPMQNKDIKDAQGDNNFIKYGVRSTLKLKSVQQKILETNRVRYGVDNVLENKKVIEKGKITILEKYNVNHIMQNKEVQEKSKATMMKNWGVEHPFQSVEIMKKIADTNIERYGFSNAMSSTIIKAKVRKTLYENGNAPCSSQQRHIHSLIGGELNFPHNGSSLDIAFPDENIYLEYNGGGHELQVKFGNVSPEDFKKKEKNRWFALYRKGWKQIEVTSKKDYLPLDEIILEMLEYAKSYLNTGHSWIRFNIDEGTVDCSQYKINYDFGVTKIHRNIKKIGEVDKSASSLI